MKDYKLTIREQVLRSAGHVPLPGVRRLISKLTPKYKYTQKFKSKFFNLDYTGDFSDMIDWNIFYFGAYAFGELAFLKHCATRLARVHHNLNFFDIGANVGQHSLYISKYVNSVQAFEPSACAANRFSLNVATNNIYNINIHRVALGDEDGKADLGSGFPGNTGSRSLNWSLPGESTESVVVREAATYLKEKLLPQIHILKIDIEGHEKKVIRSLGERLASDRPVIMMELIGHGEKGGFTSLDELRSFLYPRHQLRSLVERRGNYQILPFDWNCECAIIIPTEIATLILQ